MSIINKARTFFSRLAKLTRATLTDGTTIIEYISDELAIGDSVDVIDAEGNATAIADGSYKTEDGLSFTIKDGVVSEVTKPAAPVTESAEGKPAPTTEAAPVKQSKSAALKSHIQKFATGTPEERLTNLETMMTAVMEYCFGWRIEEKDRNSTENEAIDTYINTLKDATETAIEPVTTDVAAMKKQIATQNATIAKMSKIIEVLADKPADGKLFGAAGFNKQTGDEGSDELAKHDTLSAIHTALAKSKKDL